MRFQLAFLSCMIGLFTMFIIIVFLLVVHFARILFPKITDSIKERKRRNKR
jgi:hypothetical protein